jgi:site-specific DNA-methyltransferase (adenine-specific)
MTVIIGDCREVMAGMDASSVDAVVTDPPYELGFMGKKWDASGIACSVDLWREVLRVLKPGGHLLAFGGTRTYHRMTCAIEDAGFEIRDSLHWMYGTGFPKSLNLGDGRGTALKPGHEPIVLARKPLVGTVAKNVAEHGTGALNIDACRIGEGTGKPKPEYRPNYANDVFGKGMGGGAWENTSGRWPANVLLDEDAAEELDAQSGEAKPKPQRTGRMGASRYFYVAKPSRKERGDGNVHPTVKPVELMRYLVRLVTPPGGLVLDPFLGSGTTGVAAGLEDLRFVGVEQSEEYASIARKRMGV